MYQTNFDLFDWSKIIENLEFGIDFLVKAMSSSSVVRQTFLGFLLCKIKQEGDQHF